MRKLDGKVAIVTGAAQGLGAAIAKRLAEEGASVVLTDVNAARADAVAAGIANVGGTAHAVLADVADEAAVAELFASAEREFGGIDVVVHAAAISTSQPLIDLDLDELDRMLRTNVRGTFVVNQQAARKVRSGGAIINISSAITRDLPPGYTAYAATKAALGAITTILARELRGRDVTVNAVAPGPTETEMFLADLANSENGEQMRQGIVDATPLGRIGTPDDIAEVVLALAGPVRWVNGQVIHTSGGLV